MSSDNCSNTSCESRIYKKSKTTQEKIAVPESGFSVCIHKSTQKKLRRSGAILKTEYQLRTDAFGMLGNRELMYKNLANTKMCKYSIRGVKCPRKFCYFAHDSNELTIVDCFFGTSCRYTNDKTKPCKFLHPGETLKEYTDRIDQIASTSKDDVQVLYS